MLASALLAFTLSRGSPIPQGFSLSQAAARVARWCSPKRGTAPYGATRIADLGPLRGLTQVRRADFRHIDNQTPDGGATKAGLQSPTDLHRRVFLRQAPDPLARAYNAWPTTLDQAAHQKADVVRRSLEGFGVLCVLVLHGTIASKLQLSHVPSLSKLAPSV
jgi:hypothetical protein